MGAVEWPGPDGAGAPAEINADCIRMGWQGQASIIEMAHRAFPIQALYIYAYDNQFAEGKLGVNPREFADIFGHREKFPRGKQELSLIEIGI